MKVVCCILFLIIFYFPFFLPASSRDYPSANLSTSWSSSAGDFWRFGDNQMLRSVLINNMNNNMLQGFPAVGCGFYTNLDRSFYRNQTSELSVFFVIFAVLTTSDSNFTSEYSPKILWSANRANPVKLNATLQLTSEGDLVLREANGSLAWSTNTAGMAVNGMKIDSTGNLILYDSNNLIIWQSFDHPTDTWLPGQTLSQEQRLTSNVSPTNWTAGPYFLACSTDGLFAFIEAHPPQMYRKVLSLGSQSVTFTTGKINLIQGKSNSTAVVYVNGTEHFQYMRLDSDGHLRVYEWVQGVEGVADELLTNSLGDCGYPLICGNYGICSKGQCSCPVGNAGEPNYFMLSSSRQPSLGCVQVTQLSCQSPRQHLLLKLRDVAYFGFVADLVNTDEESCKEACLKNCSCKAALHRIELDSGPLGDCFMPSQLFSLMNSQVGPYNTSSANTSMFVKVQQPPAALSPTSSRNRTSQIKYVIPALLLLFLAIFIFICIKVKRKRKSLSEIEEDAEWENSLEPLPDLPKRFIFKDLKSATENFHSCKRLGGGGFGSVFDGTLADGTRIAVKRLDCFGQGRKEFLAEVKTMGSIHHVNLVKLIGFCVEGSHRLLVYEYMSNGSLDKWIFGSTSETALGWSTRKKIILQIAKGLAYLHEECNKRIVHLDIKPQNILLDDSFNAKLSDFGLAKLINKEETHVMTQMRGTRGYMAPEWLSRRISEKVDVYSFGVVMLEIVCGRKNLDYSQPEESEHLLPILKEKVESEKLADLIDKCSPEMQRHEKEVVDIMRTAIWCLHTDPARRPSMSTLVKALEGLINIEHMSDFKFLVRTEIETTTEDVELASDPTDASILSGPR